MKEIKPLIKYTGGKYDEYKSFKNEIPEKINNYYEPFFGGGGVFFRLHNEGKIKGKSYINDLSKDLMDFYGNVCNDRFKKELVKISDAWVDVWEVVAKVYHEFGDTFFKVILGLNPLSDINCPLLMSCIERAVEDTWSLSEYDTHGFDLCEKMFDGIVDKAKRFIKKDISEDEKDLPEKLISTALHQAFYFVVRDMYNDWLLGGEGYTAEEKSAQWFFIREFCYGSMFRFSRNGKFNVPYGGYAYDFKCFQCKIDNICSPEVQDLFAKTKISNEDFETFLNGKYYDYDDFIFLDPPYDSTFSDYDNNAFTREDQIRLRNFIVVLPCRWLLVIRKNDFISELYKDYVQVPFDKTYAYHARGTYDEKNCTHIAIRNY